MSSMRKEELAELVTWFVGRSLSFFLKCSIAEMLKIFINLGGGLSNTACLAVDLSINPGRKKTLSLYFLYYFDLNDVERQ